MQRLTFDGVNDLYLTPYGAHTLVDFEELTTIRRASTKILVPPRDVLDDVSPELASRNERCIDEHGCSCF